jgi:hypothetical protein
MTLLQLTRHQIFVDKGVICLVLFADAKARFDHAFIDSTSPWTHCVIVAFIESTSSWTHCVIVAFIESTSSWTHCVIVAFIDSTSPWTHCVIVAFIDWACFCFALNVSCVLILLQCGGGCGAKNKCTYVVFHVLIFVIIFVLSW